MNKQEWLELIAKLYPSLHLDERVINHSYKGDKKNQKILHWLEKVEEIHNIVSTKQDKHLEQLYKEMYYRLYIIKEENIPKSFYIHKQKEYEIDELTKEQKYQLTNQVIDDQKKSLDKWIEYFLYNEEAKNYPIWEKYWAFQGLQTLGQYNKETNKFSKRDKTTTSAFPPVEREALFNTLNLMEQFLKDRQGPHDIIDALTSYNFKQLYEYSLNQMKLKEKTPNNEEKGVWIKYEQGSDYHILRDSLQGYYTGWCTAAGESFAKSQLDSGDFYIYYTLDEHKEYKVPRIAIRMYGSQIISEIRGVASAQNLEPEMLPILNKKLNEFSGKDEYLKKEHDTKLLNDIYNKTKNNIELSPSELRFLYEIDNKIDGFGYLKDSRINEIKAKRSLKKDFATIFNCTEKDIGLAEEYDNYQQFKIWHGDININESSIENITLPQVITGTLRLNNLTSISSITLPNLIGGSLELSNLTQSTNLILPLYIGGTLDLSNLKSINNLKLPTNIGESIYLNNLTTATNLIFPYKIAGSLNLSNLVTATDITLPKRIGGYLDLSKLKTAEGIKFPETVSGYLDLNSLTKTENLSLPQVVGGYLNLNSLTSISDFIFPKNVGSYLELNKLKAATNVKLPTIIGDYLNLSSLTDASYLTFPTKVNGYLNLNSLTTANNISLPNTISGSLDLSSLITTNGLTLPDNINGYLNITSLKKLETLNLPDNIKGKIFTSFGVFTKDTLEQYLNNKEELTKKTK